MRHILLLVTSAHCGQCTKFRTTVWPLLTPSISGLVTVKTHNCATTKVDLPHNVPKILTSYIHSFPSLLLLTREDWNRAAKESTYLPTVYVYGYYYNTGLGKPTLEGRQVDADKMNPGKILSWINDILEGKPYIPPPESQTLEDLNSGQTLFTWD